MLTLAGTLPVCAAQDGRVVNGEVLYDFGDAAASGERELKLSADTGSLKLGNYYYLCVEIYVSDPGLLTSNCAFTVSSSAKERVRELSVNLSDYGLSSGWNSVLIYIPDFRISGYTYDNAGYEGVCDIMSICRVTLRWAVASGKQAEIRLGRICGTDSTISTPKPELRYAVREGAVALTGGESSGSAVGTGSEQLVRLMPEIINGSVNITSKKYLYFLLYVSDASLDGSDTSESFELCSGGDCDLNENAIRLASSSSGKQTLFGGYGRIKTGWNEYLVPISAFSEVTNKNGNASEGCDFSAVNYIRIYFRTKANTAGAEVTYAVSVIYAVNSGDLEDLRAKPVTTAPQEQTTQAQSTPPALTESDITTPQEGAVTTPQGSQTLPPDAEAPDGENGGTVIVVTAVCLAIAVAGGAVTLIIVRKRKK